MFLLWILLGVILFVVCLRLGILEFFIELVCDLLGSDDDDHHDGFGGGNFGGGGSSGDV